MRSKKAIEAIEAIVQWSYEQERKCDQERRLSRIDGTHLSRLAGMILILGDLRLYLEELKNKQ